MRNSKLHQHLEIVEGTLNDWQQLSRFHYRPGRPGAVDKVFVLRYRTDHDRNNRSLIRESIGPIGVIIYVMPLVNCAMRNAATSGRYLIGERSQRLALLNREMRRISRVVIHPQFRGIGLAVKLVQETLPKAESLYVETLAAMGQVNPFFAHAGMTAYAAPMPPITQRLIAACEHVNIDQGLLHDPKKLGQAMASLETRERNWIISEVECFGRHFHKSFKNVARSPEGLSRFVSEHLTGASVYYLWRNPCR